LSLLAILLGLWMARRTFQRIRHICEATEAEHIGPVSALLKKYASIPMSVADACLVRLAELREDASILTFDADFNVYRKHQHRVIPLLQPADRRV